MPIKADTVSSSEPGDGIAAVGPYRIVAELGRGGMGVVYRAQDGRTGAEVALKVLPHHLHGDVGARARLLREARAVAALDHPNVCTLLESGEVAEGAVYLAMPCYDGETLEARLSRGPLPVSEAVEVARQVARGLAAAHAAGVVHRDLKPSNVFLCTDGTARVMDFGIARLDGATGTRSGGTSGTLQYSAPEQINGDAGPASDLWALGVVAYEMLAGQRPFRGRYDAALLYAILHGAPDPLRRARPEVPEAVEAVVLRCLEKQAEDRFASAEAAAEALAAALAGASPGRSPRARRRLAFSGALLSFSALAGVFAWPSVHDALYPLPEQRQIAVLPFDAPGADSTGHIFADGLAETISNELSGFEGVNDDLWVVPFGTVRERRIERAEDAWRSMRATLVVTGRVYRTAEGVRLPLQLVDTRTGRQLRSATVEAQADELDALSHRAVRALGAMLDAALRAEAVRSGGTFGSITTDVPEAYEAYLLGRGFLGDAQDVPVAHVAAAREEFARAVQLDPDFPEALAMLAWWSYDLTDGTGEPQWSAQSDSLVERALALAPDAPIVLNTYAFLQARRGDTEEAIGTLEQALNLDPLYLPAYAQLAYLLVEADRWEEAEALLRTAIQRRPKDPQAYYDLANFLGNERPREAKAIALEGLRLDPEHHMMSMLLGGIAERLGEDGVPYYERAAVLRPTPFVYGVLGRRSYERGDSRGALEYYRRALELDTVDDVQHTELAWALWRIPSERQRSMAAFRACARRFEGVFRGEVASEHVPYSSDLKSAVTLAQCYAGGGQTARARAVMAAIRPAVHDEQPYESSRLYVLLGDTLRTEPVDLLHEAYSRSRRSGGWISRMLPHMPEHHALLRQPRWAELERARERLEPNVPSARRGPIYGDR